MARVRRRLIRRAAGGPASAGHPDFDRHASRRSPRSLRLPAHRHAQYRFFRAGRHVFTNIACQTPLTLPSHTSLFTSTYPFENGIQENAEQVPRWSGHAGRRPQIPRLQDSGVHRQRLPGAPDGPRSGFRHLRQPFQFRSLLSTSPERCSLAAWRVRIRCGAAAMEPWWCRPPCAGWPPTAVSRSSFSFIFSTCTRLTAVPEAEARQQGRLAVTMRSSNTRTN